MSKKSKQRSKDERRKKKQAKKTAKRALYLAQASQGKAKGGHQTKRLDPNRYGKIWEQQSRKAA